MLLSRLLEAVEALTAENIERDPSIVARLTAQIGEVMCAAGRRDEALVRFKEAFRLVEDRPLIQLEVLTAQAACEQSSGQLEGAEQALRTALSILEQQRGKVAGGAQERQLYLAHQARVGETLLDVLISDGNLEEALLTSESLKARTLLDVLGGGRAGSTDPARYPAELTAREGELLAQVAALRREAVVGDGLAEAARGELADAERALRDVRMQMAALQPAGSAERQLLDTRSLDDLSAPLGDDEVALVYAVTPEAVHLFVVRQGALRAHRIEDPEGLRRDVRRIRRYLSHPDPGFVRGPEVLDEAPGDDATADQVFRWVAANLHRRLWAVAGADLEGASRVVVVPDGFLHYLPFEVLIDPEGRFLAESTTTTYTPSLTTLGALRRTSRESASGPSLFGVADPTFEVREGSDRGDSEAAEVRRGVNLVALPGTRAEAEAILEHLEGAEFLMGEDASESRVADILDGGGHRYLHFATHGLVPDDVSWLSQPALVMSFAHLDEGEDGLLDMAEIEALDLDAEVVVMSACQTGVGQELKGEGLLGLSRAFLNAGSQRVVASLWSVSDEATAELMAEFYRGLADHAPAEALRGARLATMDRYPHPYYWGAFIITGR